MAVNAGFDNPLSDHSKYATVKYLSEGSFGFVLLAKEKATGKQVIFVLPTKGLDIHHDADSLCSDCDASRHLPVCRWR